MAHALLTERTLNIQNVYENTDFDFSDIFEFDKRHGYRTQSFLAVPLRPRDGEVLGVLVLLNARGSGSGRIVGFSEESRRFMEALASQAAVAQDNQNLMETQTRLLDAIIQVIAGAIDTKSPYTGGHCARVPVIGDLSQAEMLRLSRIPPDPASLPAGGGVPAGGQERAYHPAVQGGGVRLRPQSLRHQHGHPQASVQLRRALQPSCATRHADPGRVLQDQGTHHPHPAHARAAALPEAARRVAEFAASHHETMSGTGYPRGIAVQELPLQSRILAIADIFEALTASDRPYKKAKTLNEAIRIMSFMRNDRLIDADLFDLFLTSGVYRTFTDKYLKPEQIDAVDIGSYLSKAPDPAGPAAGVPTQSPRPA